MNDETRKLIVDIRNFAATGVSVTLANDGRYTHEILTKAANWIENASGDEPGAGKRRLEIGTVGQRYKVSEALVSLWDALRLSDQRGKNDIKDIHYLLYRLIGQTLLGKCCPENEVLT